GTEAIFSGQYLEVRQHFDTVSRKSGFDKFLAYKVARRQEKIDASQISFEPAVQVGFGSENSCAGTRPCVAVLRYGVAIAARQALFAGAPVGDEVVRWTKNLEVIQMVKHRDLLLFQLPKDRRRQVMVDAADVREIRLVVRNASPH